MREEVRAPLIREPFRVVHLSDLHVAGETPLLRRLVGRVAAAEPDLVLVSGDLIAGTRATEQRILYARAAARLFETLGELAPVLAVQGHADYHGDVVGVLAEAGVDWLSNEGRRIGPGGSILLLGLNQQVGHDAFVELDEAPFEGLEAGGILAAGWRRLGGRGHRHLSYDPSPRHLADTSGPFAWGGYEVTCEVWMERRGSAAGVTAHSRYALGEHRMIRLRPGPEGTFALVFDGSGPAAGPLDTGVASEPGRWYRLRLRTEVALEGVRALARAWPDGEEEPSQWQAWGLDASATRVEAGTVGLWAAGPGATAFRDLRVELDEAGRILEEPFSGGLPRGWQDGARGTRLELAMARSPEPGEGFPLVVLTHDPASAREAAHLGAALVLAGHTHGGQVRVPGIGALITRSALGRRYDRGLFPLSSPGEGAATLLFVNAGIGTSFVPVRFFSPPTFAVVTLGGDEIEIESNGSTPPPR